VQKLGLELAKHHLFENLGATPLSQLREVTRSGGSSRTNRRSSLDRWPVETIELVTLPPPDEAEARRLFDQGRELYRESRYREALDRFERALEEYGDTEHLLHIALCHLRLGEREPALERLTSFLIEDNLTSPEVEAIYQEIEEAPDSMFASSAPADRERRGELADRLQRTIAAARERRDDREVAEIEAEAAARVTPTPEVAAGRPPEEPEAPRPPTDERLELRPTGGEAERPPPLQSTRSEEPGRVPLRRPADRDDERPTPTRTAESGAEEEEEQVRLTVSFRLRRIERRGTFTLSMKQWNRVELPVRFAANVGDLPGRMSDAGMFRRVSLDDPMFKQREIPVTVDVASEQEFAAMLTAVTVALRKRHQSGEQSIAEVTIMRSDFSSGELVTLLYGWSGDDDRTRWLEYDHRVRWSYVGGPVIDTGWQRTTAGALVLEPPLRPRELLLEADPEVLREQGVRDVVVEVTYQAGDAERTAHATVRPSDEVGRQKLVLYQDPQRPGYSYSFDWRLYGGRRVSAGPFEDTADYIYLDEIPRQGEVTGGGR
jgi:tetratricopeptide (TPR) repeat protein